MTTVKVHPRNDVAEVHDGMLQTVLKSYIEHATGRKVVGDVIISIDTRFGQVGVAREGMYTATCDLETKP